RRRHTCFSRDWSSDVCSSDLDHKHPMVVIQVMFADSLVNRASGAFVKTFVPNQNERPIGGGRTWTVEGRKVEIHSLQLVDFEERSEERRVGKNGRDRWAHRPH